MTLLGFLFPPSTTAAEAYDAAQRRDVVIVDVRERHEWRAGHAPRSVNVPLAGLGSRIGELRADRRYVAVCRTGARSRSATAALRRAGLDAVNLKGGMLAWRRAGLPLEPRNGRVA
jgi:rhodanese-related sulfurtransferase